jgi:hypothetical protein
MLGVVPSIFARGRFRLPLILLVAIALLPAAFITARVISASRDVVYWDEFDTALSLILQLDHGMGWRQVVTRLFEVSNEHRMVTSRLMFATGYWLTGTVDFAVISFTGNVSLLFLCALLIWSVKTIERRLRLGVVLAMVMFQLQHYENFLWSGSSIDHFQVVMLAGVTVVGLARRTRPGLVIAAIGAVLATFTLAHGIIAWVIGAAMLARHRRFAPLAVWCAAGALTATGFLAGFHFNSAHHFTDPSVAGVIVIAHYWLALLGAVPALGHAATAPWMGLVLLLALAWLAVRGTVPRESVAFPLACYAVAALALIAIGRAAEAGEILHSRYYVLGALAWGLTIFMALERQSSARRPYVLLWCCLPLLLAFNVAANRVFAAKADSWLECRDRAALRFKQHGVDGRGPFALHPTPTLSTRLLNEAEKRGIYRMGSICDEREFPDAQPSARITYFVDELAVTERAAAVSGWAAIPGLPSKRGQIHIVLRSAAETHVFTAVTITRPDVAAALHQPGLVLAGFRFARRRDRLPTGDFQVGFLIKHGGDTEYIMTSHRLQLVGEGKALLASAD